jgi:GDP-4-dehydro-6-deoxy-D-mannose reductase
VRVLVTGAGGFVGRHLCKYLTLVGDEVIACPGPDGPGALDVTDSSAVAQRIASLQPDGIVHLAGISSVSWSHANPARTFLVNGLGTLNVLQAVREGARNARVLLISSGEVYGRVRDGHFAREEDPVQPLSPYSASKCASEDLARQYAASYSVQVICARPFNHIGAGQAPHFVVPSFARQLVEIKRGRDKPVMEVGDLNPVRDFLHVADVVRGYRLLLERGEGQTPYNVCSGEPISIRELLNQLVEIAGAQVEIRVDSKRLRPAEIPWLVGNATRLHALGWRREHTVEAALMEALREAMDE